VVGAKFQYPPIVVCAIAAQAHEDHPKTYLRKSWAQLRWWRWFLTLFLFFFDLV
jgi:hypothetical protein